MAIEITLHEEIVSNASATGWSVDPRDGSLNIYQDEKLVAQFAPGIWQYVLDVTEDDSEEDDDDA